MPAARLTEQSSSVQPFDIVGMELRDDDIPRHVAFFDGKTARDDVTVHTVLEVCHMGPPPGRARGVCGAVGSFPKDEKLSAKLKAFSQRRLLESKLLRKQRVEAGKEWDRSLQYCIHPSYMRPGRANPTWRFSCVGFVLSALDFCKIKLLDQPAPFKNLEQLKEIYCDDRLDQQDFRQRMGIAAGNQWPVYLPGYVLNAICLVPAGADLASCSAYVPAEGDEFFPSRRPEADGVGG